MSGELGGASISQVRKHRQAGIHRGLQLLQRWIAMPCGDPDSPFCEETNCSPIRIRFRSKRHQEQFSRSGLVELGGDIRSSGEHAGVLVGANVTRFRIEEGPLEVDPGYHPRNQGIRVDQSSQVASLLKHCRKVIRDQCRQESLYAARGELLANLQQLFRCQLTVIKVNALPAVDLKIENRETGQVQSAPPGSSGA
jgi:hypothetical protein